MDTELLQYLQPLTDKQREYVVARQTGKKETSTAYICWFLVGVHYFYLGKPFINILYWLTGGGFLIWLVIDLFRIPGMVKRYNRKLLLNTIEEAKMLYPTPQE